MSCEQKTRQKNKYINLSLLPSEVILFLWAHADTHEAKDSWKYGLKGDYFGLKVCRVCEHLGNSCLKRRVYHFSGADFYCSSLIKQ